jgi:hypothetical protein
VAPGIETGKINNNNNKVSCAQPFIIAVGNEEFEPWSKWLI